MSANNILLSIQKQKSTLNYPKYNNVCSYGIYSKELKNEFETAMANELSVFEPLKFNCIFLRINRDICQLAVFGRHLFTIWYPSGHLT